MLKLFVFVFQKALRTGTCTRLDERVFAMCEFKTQPLQQLMRLVHPDLYRLDNMSDQVRLHNTELYYCCISTFILLLINVLNQAIIVRSLKCQKKVKKLCSDESTTVTAEHQ